MITAQFDLRFKVFILFSLFLLIEGFFFYYSYKLSYLCIDNFTFSIECASSFFKKGTNGFNSFVWGENGLVEIIQSLLLLCTIFYLLKIIKRLNKKISKKIFIYFFSLYFLGIIYFFFEEISWGQNIFQWQSNSFFLEHNNQGETNFHNISNLFNQLPRSLLIFWCSLSFLIFKVSTKFTQNNDYLKFVFPKKEIKYISTILILFVMPDLIIDKFNLNNDYGIQTYDINLYEIYTFISFNFIRLSEYQELIITFYLFNHALFFKKYLDHST